MKRYKTYVPALILSAAMIFSSCGQPSTYPVKHENDTVREAVTETPTEEHVLSEKTFVPDREHVKMLGRTTLNNDILWLAQTDSGCEFTFTGQSASVTVVGDSVASSANGEGNYARFAVYINGERTIDELVKEPEKTYELFNSAEPDGGTVTVRIIKLSEAPCSTMGLKDIRTVSYDDISPVPEKDLRIEFIGDSITCGYGVDDEVKEHHFSTATEDGTKTYAYKTAEALDADYSMVCFSGHGIISGYTSNGKKDTVGLVPKYYEMPAHSYGSAPDFSVNKQEWDFSLFKPDVIVINLGTNDSSYCGRDEERAEEFKEKYKEFLVQVRSHNPDAHILCTLGIMGYDLYDRIEEAVSEYSSETGDTKVSAMMFEPQSMDDGIAADWHPTEKTHQKAAERLTEEIKNIISQ